ncbi:aldolase/citrate lyase family protein [Amycolatopsis orientalis]|uniref:aldolase/citrate lyase family protein n=1 Tax=Amycolatopsis orientalis TaxID=31958 RepID=UPI0003999C46|nr:aldolase/citrate lyase family protein [Amycolatopsis orientalis]
MTRRVGVLTAEPDRLLITQIAQAGLGFVVLDAEQTTLSADRCADVVRALAGSGVEVSVRVPDLAPQTLVTYANIGVTELLLPQVRTLAEIEAAHRATRFPPAGTRSRQVSYASRYGTEFSGAPRIAVLVETVDAVEQAASFAESGLVGAAWFGPTDLADDLRANRPEAVSRLPELIDRALGVFREHGVPVGLPAADAAGVAAAFARGADACSVYWEKCLLNVLRGLTEAGR